ncbi:MAG TPA: (deoxy)nucleoside triphosphate pyrophosphohydrolase [Veillonellaceae bacterium]|nr:(deoxy)nucleoside triphosphate pyrophosphohydrolase [Veillonellaceae bacterium]
MKTIHVAAAVIVENHKIFAARRGYGEFKGYWEFPGGKIEKNETPETALRREIKEELAADIKVDRFLGTVDYDYPHFHLTMECYLCHVAMGTLTILEHSAFRWVKKEELETVDWLGADRIAVEWVKGL